MAWASSPDASWGGVMGMCHLAEAPEDPDPDIVSPGWSGSASGSLQRSRRKLPGRGKTGNLYLDE